MPTWCRDVVLLGNWMLIDTHCHLDPDYFPEGSDAVLARARQVGVEHFVVIGVGKNLDAAAGAVALAGARDDVSASVGMHPHDAAQLDDASLKRLSAWALLDCVVAIGEAGLDYHYMHAPEEQQKKVFRIMIDLAKTSKKPLIVHTRSAAKHTLQILREENAAAIGGIIHCFSEDRDFARQALDLAFDLSFSGIVTFKNAKAVQDVARWAPSDRIMVETDSPYLSPDPMRGRRNEPAHVVHTARWIAEARGETFEDFCLQTSAVAKKRFSLTLVDQ